MKQLHKLILLLIIFSTNSLYSAKVSFNLVSEQDYLSLIDIVCKEYQNNMKDSGLNGIEAQEAKNEIDSLLPNGMHTPGHYIYNIEDYQKNNVGFIWYMCDLETSAAREAFICFLYLKPEYRKKGYAQAALEFLEIQVNEKNIKKISLNIFACNKTAFSLYLKNGYLINKTIYLPNSNIIFRYELEKVL